MFKLILLCIFVFFLLFLVFPKKEGYTLSGNSNGLSNYNGSELSWTPLKEKCLTNTYITLPIYNFNLPIKKFEFNLAQYLLALSFNVEISNCTNLGALPPPTPFDVQIKLTGTSFLGIQRMFGYFFYATALNVALLIFSGTFFDDEWAKDLEMKQITANKLNGYKPGVLIHEGFYTIYTTLQDQILNATNKYMNKDTKLFISGHSLGAALATIAAFDLHLKKPLIYSFASPRVFNINGVQIFNQNVLQSKRIYNTEDIFTTIPIPVNSSIDYDHVNSGVGFTRNLKVVAYNHTDAYLETFKLPQRTS